MKTNTNRIYNLKSPSSKNLQANTDSGQSDDKLSNKLSQRSIKIKKQLVMPELINYQKLEKMSSKQPEINKNRSNSLQNQINKQESKKQMEIFQKGKSMFKETYIQSDKIQGFCPKQLQSPERKNIFQLRELREQKSRQQKLVYQKKDDRLLVDKLQYPYTALGLLMSIFRKSGPLFSGHQPYSGTAFLIGPKLLMTAAHNLYSKQDDQVLETLIFYLPDDTNKINFDKPYKVKDHICPPQYQQMTNQADKLFYDYAFIQLQEMIGEYYGWFGINLNIDQQNIINQKVFLFGFPGQINGQKNKQYKMFGQNGKIINCNKKFIQYQISTTSGQSGAPVFYKDKKNYYVIGIHCQQGDKNQNSNKGFLITKQNLITQLQQQKKIKSTIIDYRIDAYDLEISKEKIEACLKKKLPDLLKIQLKILQLSYCQIGIKGITMIVNCQLPTLKTLILNNNQAGEKGAQILSGGNWPQLVELKIGSNNIYAKGAEYISKGQWNKLNMLYIENNAIGSQGVQHIIRGYLWPLEVLNVEQNNLYEFDVKSIIGRFKNLKRLKIKYNMESQDALRIAKEYRKIVFD